MLQTPYFLYHWELGPNAPLKDVKGDPKIARFNSYEMASRLSYLFWTSMPDDKLFEAAAAGKLNSPEEIGQASRRLLEDARAKDAIADFHMQWLEVGSVAELQKDPSFTNWTPGGGRRRRPRGGRRSPTACSSAPRPTASWRR